jgi:hypothetical protein
MLHCADQESNDDEDTRTSLAEKLADLIGSFFTGAPCALAETLEILNNEVHIRISNRSHVNRDDEEGLQTLPRLNQSSQRWETQCCRQEHSLLLLDLLIRAW